MQSEIFFNQPLLTIAKLAQKSSNQGLESYELFHRLNNNIYKYIYKKEDRKKAVKAIKN